MSVTFNPFTGNLDFNDTTKASGSDTQIQFNDGGKLSGDSGLVFNKTTDALTIAGPVIHPLGAAATPSLTFTGDPNTGIFSPGADQLAISTNGTGRLFVDASGNVYSAAPANTVPTGVARNLTVSTAFSDTDLPGIGLDQRRSSVGSHGSFFWSGRSTGGNARLLGSISLEQTVATTANGGGDILFNTNPGTAVQPIERARITSDGRLGLGTSSPGATLHIEAAGNTVNQRIFTSDNVQDATASLTFGTTPGSRSKAAVVMVNTNTGNSTGALALQTNNGTALDTALYITHTGRVGIGTTSPSSNLHVNGANSSTVAIISIPGNSTNNYNDFALNFNNGSINGAVFRAIKNSAAGADLVFLNSSATNNAATEKARIDSSGRLLVGTSTSRTGYRLQVEGTSFEDASVSIARNAENAASGSLGFRKSRGSSAGSFTTVVAEDLLGLIIFSGANGTSDLTAAQISAFVDGEPNTSGDSTDMPGRLVFSTTADGAATPTERMRITSTGQVRLAGAGITFNGDTAAANELDDYEEGTWTPTSTSGAYAAASGTYTKIGRVVTLNFSVTFPASGMTQNARLNSIPFSVAQAGSSDTTTDAGFVIRTMFDTTTPTVIRLADAAGVSRTESSLYGKVVSGTLTYFA